MSPGSDSASGESPYGVGWKERTVEVRRYSGLTVVDTELVPDPSYDLFSESLDELRAAYADALREFRETCAPTVGLTVTVRGRKICEPAVVPVDPRAYFTRRWRLAKESISETWERVREVFRPLADAMQKLGAESQDDYTLT